MWLAFFVAVLATAGNHIGKVFQKRGTDDLPRFSLEWSVLKAYLRNSHWLGGFLGDVTGAVFTAVALGLAPVSTVQPIISSGIIFLVVFSYFYLGEDVRAMEWFGVFLCVAGAVGIGVTMVKGQDQLNPKMAMIVLAVILTLGVVCEVLYRRGQWVEFATGVQAGLGFGLSAAVMRTGMLLAKQYSNWLWGALGLGASFLVTSVAFYLQTRGLKDGRAVAIGTFTNVFVLLTAVIAGLVALNEPMPSTTIGWYARVGSFGLIILGSVFMARK